MALAVPFGSQLDAGLAPAGPLQAELTSRLDASTEKAAFAHMGIALVDLTNIAENVNAAGPMTVACAANARFATQLAVGSLSKIAIMFAAFALRERMVLAAADVGTSAKDVDDMVAKVTAD